MITNLFTHAISKSKIDITDAYIRQIIDYGNDNVQGNGQTEGNLHTVELFNPLARMFSDAVHTHIVELGFDTDN